MFRRFYSRFFKPEKTDCTAHFKCGQEQVSLTCNILTGDTFTGKTNFFFIPPMQGERAEFAFIEIHLRKTARCRGGNLPPVIRLSTRADNIRSHLSARSAVNVCHRHTPPL